MDIQKLAVLCIPAKEITVLFLRNCQNATQRNINVIILLEIATISTEIDNIIIQTETGDDNWLLVAHDVLVAKEKPLAFAWYFKKCTNG